MYIRGSILSLNDDWGNRSGCHFIFPVLINLTLPFQNAGIQGGMVCVSRPWKVHARQQLLLRTLCRRAAATAGSQKDKTLQCLLGGPMQQLQLLICPRPPGAQGLPRKEGALPTLQRGKMPARRQLQICACLGRVGGGLRLLAAAPRPTAAATTAP